ncbi:hypothetical protein KHQ82_02570 [Mycoplasmatota bacterium]|nr:hypothetical protein KHQ82_02570 [Mycoplasmatota bacterium]
MSFQWYSKNESEGIATIYDSNITLNKSASGYLESAYSVMLGYDPANQIIAIRPLTKETDNLGHIPDDKKYKITVKPSYSRISNKLFIKSLSEDTGIKFKKSEAHKFLTHWVASEKILTINLNEEVK